MYPKVDSAHSAEPKENKMAQTELPTCEWPIALVYWADATTGDPGWVTLDTVEEEGETLVMSVGFLIPVDAPGGRADHITLLQSHHDGDGIGLFYIPSGMVRKISVVTP